MSYNHLHNLLAMKLSLSMHLRLPSFQSGCRSTYTIIPASRAKFLAVEYKSLLLTDEPLSSRVYQQRVNDPFPDSLIKIGRMFIVTIISFVPRLNCVYFAKLIVNSQVDLLALIWTAI